MLGVWNNVWTQGCVWGGMGESNGRYQWGGVLNGGTGLHKKEEVVVEGAALDSPNM